MGCLRYFSFRWLGKQEVLHTSGRACGELCCPCCCRSPQDASGRHPYFPLSKSSLKTVFFSINACKGELCEAAAAVLMLLLPQSCVWCHRLFVPSPNSPPAFSCRLGSKDLRLVLAGRGRFVAAVEPSAGVQRSRTLERFCWFKRAAWISLSPSSCTVRHPFWLNPAFCWICIFFFLLVLVANRTLSLTGVILEIVLPASPYREAWFT